MALLDSGLNIGVEWMLGTYDAGPISACSAELSIRVGSNIATRIEDRWSKTTREDVYLSAYPLALWVASSWWRLRWEPESPASTSTSWRMAHQTSAIGYGFLWPRLTFESDGESVRVTSARTDSSSPEMYAYLEDFTETISVTEFDSAIDTFVPLVLARLDAMKVRDTELHSVWRELTEERVEPSATVYRKLEAQLGYDPDEAPEAEVTELTSMFSEVGEDAVYEVASACPGPAAAQKLKRLSTTVQADGVSVTLPQAGPLARSPGLGDDVGGHSWKKGYRVAGLAREQWGLREYVPNSDLGRLFGAEPEKLIPNTSAAGLARTDAPAMGLAVLQGKNGDARLLLRRNNQPGLRFEIARILADRTIAPRDDRWLPVTDSRTWRQRFQRAFAAELLCPIEALKSYLEAWPKSPHLQRNSCKAC